MKRRTPKKRDLGLRCAGCGHLESEHGTTGTRPCLAAIGDLPDRDFCPCDAFHPELSKAA